MPRPKKIVDKEVPKKKFSRGRKEIITVTGMRDILPQDQKYWQAVYRMVEKIANDYGYSLIETPILEDRKSVV